VLCRIVLCSPLVRRAVTYEQSKTRGLHRGVFIGSGIDVSALLGSDFWKYPKTMMNTYGTPNITNANHLVLEFCQVFDDTTLSRAADGD
jgi:hypothetical protein